SVSDEGEIYGVTIARSARRISASSHTLLDTVELPGDRAGGAGAARPGSRPVCDHRRGRPLDGALRAIPAGAPDWRLRRDSDRPAPGRNDHVAWQHRHPVAPYTGWMGLAP